CVCLPWQISKWDLKFRSNFSRPAARNLSEFPGLFAIAPCIYTESIFWWIQINTQLIGQKWHNTTPHLVAERPVTSPNIANSLTVVSELLESQQLRSVAKSRRMVLLRAAS